LFADESIPALRLATSDLSWLLTRDYAAASALKLVGDRYGLTARQRLAVARAAASDQQIQRRRENCLALEEITDADLLIDGFNLIITVEAALAGGVLLACRDSCVRDLSSVHGSYRSVEETARAINLIGEALAPHRPRSVTWLLDKPVSNSGRLAQQIASIADVARRSRDEPGQRDPLRRAGRADFRLGGPRRRGEVGELRPPARRAPLPRSVARQPARLTTSPTDVALA
jgi:hypothetical protein